jgi:hypothetical protein
MSLWDTTADEMANFRESLAESSTSVQEADIFYELAR